MEQVMRLALVIVLALPTVGIMYWVRTIRPWVAIIVFIIIFVPYCYLAWLFFEWAISQ
jgi:hypothetical protein